MTITSNKLRRTFTIRKENSKFRTLEMSKKEFDECDYNTILDWKDFLTNEIGSYYEVRKYKTINKKN
tara:strand:+ start:55 stop:255 length:201 start_codon:yes stop_codon:yes gene_type:complete